MIGGHLRPRPRPPLYFLMGCVSAPKTREPTAAPPNPTAHALHGTTIGSGGAMSWWCRSSTHGGRGQKPLGGRAASAHFRCCVLCVLVLQHSTLCYTILHDDTLFYMMLHYLTLSNTIIHYYTLLYTILHCDTRECRRETIFWIMWTLLTSTLNQERRN